MYYMCAAQQQFNTNRDEDCESGDVMEALHDWTDEKKKKLVLSNRRINQRLAHAARLALGRAGSGVLASSADVARRRGRRGGERARVAVRARRGGQLAVLSGRTRSARGALVARVRVPELLPGGTRRARRRRGAAVLAAHARGARAREIRSGRVREAGAAWTVRASCTHMCEPHKWGHTCGHTHE